MKNKLLTVNDYIAAAPTAIRPKLRQLRGIIRLAVPRAEEKLSYGMPYYGYKGRLVYFGYAKEHIGLYIPPPVIQEFKKELAGYETAMATARFPLDLKLPATLIRKLVLARAKKNEAKSK